MLSKRHASCTFLAALLATSDVLALASGQKPGQKKPGPGQAIEHGLLCLIR